MRAAALFFSLILLNTTSCASSLTLQTAEDPSADSSNTDDSSPLLTITALNVGQGDATLLKTRNGNVALIDAGPDQSGASVILPYLRGKGIDHIDWVFISQYDADHFAGLDEVLLGEDGLADTEDDVTVGRVYDRGEPDLDPGFHYDAYAAIIAPYRRELLPGDAVTLDTDTTAHCLMINGNTSEGDTLSPSVDDENAHSMALLLNIGGTRYLTAGDLPGGGLDTVDFESILAGIAGEVDILHVNHHGSASSTNTAYLEALKPSLALISAGNENGYGHPHPEVLRRLADWNVAAYITEAAVALPESEILKVAEGPIEIRVWEDRIWTVDTSP